MKYKKTKIILFFLGFFCLLFGSLNFLLKNKNNNFFEIKLNLNKRNLNNQYSEAKVDPIYKIKTIRKTGNDEDRINILFMNDNTNESFNDENYFSDWIDKKISIPWFSTEHSYVNNEKKGVFLPFQTYLNDKFNMYSIQIPSNFSSSITNNDQTFFGIHTNNVSDILNIRSYGKIKKNVLTHDINNNFLQDSGIVTYKNQNLIYFGNQSIRAVSDGFSLTASNSKLGTTVHEFGHSIFGLVDEYDSRKGIGPNRSYENDPNKIKWKEFLNFRGVGIYNAPGSKIEYIPSLTCVMKSSSSSEFCEVCAHHMITFIAKTLGHELFYIADPQLTTKHSDYNDNSYWTESLEQSELYNFNIEKANNQILEFRTVVDNMTLTNKEIKLKITIKDKSGNTKFTEESPKYEILPNEIKGLVLYTTKDISELKNNENTIIGEVIDTKTNEVLASSLDRRNLSFLYQFNNEPDKKYGKKLYKIKINFLNKTTNKPLEDIKSTSIIQRDKTTYKLEKILFQGYKFVNSSNANMQIKIDGKDVEVNYYYEKLPYKNLKLKLIDENQKNVEEKIVKVYENQEFKPKNSDFLIYDLENFNGTNSSANKNWKWKINPPSINSISYDQITDNKTELLYNKISNDGDMYMDIKDQKIPQGSDIERLQKYSQSYFKQFNISFNYDFNYIESGSSIIYNDVNISKPGNYKMTYYIDQYVNELNKNLKKYKNIKVTVVPSNHTNKINELDAEINRLNSLSYLWLKKYDDGNNFGQQEFDAINEQNILDNLSNLALNKNDFSYEVIEFQKNNENHTNPNPFNHYFFKIKVSKDGNSKNTDAYTKNIWFRNEAISELDKQIQKVNKLNLKLIKNTFDIETINLINEFNIHEYVSNWNDVVSNNKLKYEVKNFTKSDGIIRFNILITENNESKFTKYFNFNYFINLEGNENLINDEINRLNQIKIELKQVEFTKSELNNINQNNFINFIKNWNNIASNKSLNYKISNFSIISNKFKFNIEISNSTGFSKLSKLFEINFLLKDSNIINPSINDKTNNGVGKIIGAVIGSILGILSIIGIVFLVFKKKRNK